MAFVITQAMSTIDSIKNFNQDRYDGGTIVTTVYADDE